MILDHDTSVVPVRNDEIRKRETELTTHIAALILRAAKM